MEIKVYLPSGRCASLSLPKPEPLVSRKLKGFALLYFDLLADLRNILILSVYIRFVFDGFFKPFAFIWRLWRPLNHFLSSLVGWLGCPPTFSMQRSHVSDLKMAAQQSLGRRVPLGVQR